MTKEELQEIADMYGLYTEQDVENLVSCELLGIGARNEELEKENEELKKINSETLTQLNLDNGELIIENEKLRKENTELRDNYDQFKASAIPEIERLQKENAELKNIKDVADLIRLNNSSIVAMACLNNHNTSLHQELAQARKIILKLYNAGRDVLMCRAEEKAYDNLDNAINDRSIEQFLKEIEK